MRIIKRDNHYWITDVGQGEECGPYDTKAAAASDMRGIQRYRDHGDEAGFVSCETAGQPRSK